MRWLRGRRVESNEEVEWETEECFGGFDKSYYLEGIEKLKDGWTRCIELKGEFQRFKNDDFSVEDKPRCGQPKKFEDGELEALLDEDPTQTQEELTDTSGVTEHAVSERLKSMGMIQKQGNWVPYELKSRNADFAACQRSVQCCKIGENILANAEKWIDS